MLKAILIAGLPWLALTGCEHGQPLLSFASPLIHANQIWLQPSPVSNGSAALAVHDAALIERWKDFIKDAKVGWRSRPASIPIAAQTPTIVLAKDNRPILLLRYSVDETGEVAGWIEVREPWSNSERILWARVLEEEDRQALRNLFAQSRQAAAAALISAAAADTELLALEHYVSLSVAVQLGLAQCRFETVQPRPTVPDVCLEAITNAKNVLTQGSVWHKKASFLAAQLATVCGVELIPEFSIDSPQRASWFEDAGQFELMLCLAIEEEATAEDIWFRNNLFWQGFSRASHALKAIEQRLADVQRTQ